MPRPKQRARRLLAILGGIAALALVILFFVGGVGRRDAHPRGSNTRTGLDPTATPTLQDSGDPESRVLPETGERIPAQDPPTRDSLPSGRAGIRGRVVDDSTGAPLEAFEILASPVGAEHQVVDTILGFESATPAGSETFEDARGTFEIAAVEGESQSVCAFATGYERSEPVIATTADELEIRLKRGAKLHGRVIDPATGVPVEGALVAWVDQHGRPRTGPRETFTRTDALGRFALPSVPLSAKNVLAGREDLGEGMSERLVLAAGDLEREIVIELRRSGG